MSLVDWLANQQLVNVAGKWWLVMWLANRLVNLLVESSVGGWHCDWS
jgi:hypothetical protein